MKRCPHCAMPVNAKLKTCKQCDQPFWGSASRIYCSNACKQAAYRAAAPAPPLKEE